MDTVDTVDTVDGAGGGAVVRLYDTAREAIAPLDVGPLVTLYSCGTVSYTHLDVYKRQQQLHRQHRQNEPDRAEPAASGGPARHREVAQWNP